MSTIYDYLEEKSESLFHMKCSKIAKVLKKLSFENRSNKTSKILEKTQDGISKK